jgi:hypothetical protein
VQVFEQRRQPGLVVARDRGVQFGLGGAGRGGGQQERGQQQAFHGFSLSVGHFRL